MEARRVTSSESLTLRVFRNAVLAQRQRVIDAESGARGAVGTAAPAVEASSDVILAEIRDILARIETRLAPEDKE